MFRRLLTTLLILAGVFPAYVVLAQNATSPNFQNTDSSILPLIVNSQSASYKIDGSVEPIVGVSQSASVKIEIGAQGSPGTPPVPPIVIIPPTTGGGGGGGGGTPLPAPTSTAGPELEPAPTINPRRWTYKSTAMVNGLRGVSGAEIFLNGSSVGVVYPSLDTWERLLPLGLGDNSVYVQAKLGDRMSRIVYGMVHRRLIGDVNDNRVVDDVDLSLFTRHWKTFDIQSDFNEDGLIDDIDLSLLASHWGKRY